MTFCAKVEAGDVQFVAGVHITSQARGAPRAAPPAGSIAQEAHDDAHNRADEQKKTCSRLDEESG